MKDHSLKFITIDKITEVPVGPSQSILDLAVKAGIPISYSCGGMGTCGTCRVIIERGLNLMEMPNSIEAEMIQDRGFQPEERLACQNSAQVGLMVKVPPITKIQK